jgi:hypothetical protein
MKKNGAIEQRARGVLAALTFMPPRSLICGNVAAGEQGPGTTVAKGRRAVIVRALAGDTFPRFRIGP